MEFIERYIYAVTKDLPEKERRDVELELRANIEDMLGQNYETENIKRVLEELGDPDKLADEYRGTKRYLIGPNYYSTYIMILKLVISIVASVLGAVSLFSVVLQPPAAGDWISYIADACVSVIQAVFSGAFGAAVWVTVVFAIVEKTNTKIPNKETPWSVEKLPQKPTKSSKISRAEVIVSLIFYVLWIGVLLMSPNIIGIYEAGYGMTPLFDPAVLQHYLPLIIALSGFGIFVAIIKLIYGRWNGRTAVLNLIMNVFNLSAIILLLRNDLLFNPAFFDRFRQLLGISQAAFDLSTNTFIWSIIVLTIIGTITDSISGFVKAYKAKK